jgi:hypothetical protein
MKKVLTIFFVSLGVIFFFILIGLAYLWFADSFEIRPLLERYRTPAMSTDVAEVASEGVVTATATQVSTDVNPNLSPAQEDALLLIGIDPTLLPKEVTAEQMACFVRVLGQARVDEILAGAAPTPIELLIAKDCL